MCFFFFCHAIFTSCPFLARYSHTDSAGHRRARDHATGPRGSAERPRVPALSLAPSACARAQRVQCRTAPRGAVPRPLCGWVDLLLWCSLSSSTRGSAWSSMSMKEVAFIWSILNVTLCGKILQVLKGPQVCGRCSSIFLLRAYRSCNETIEKISLKALRRAFSCRSWTWQQNRSEGRQQKVNVCVSWDKTG